MTHMIFRHGDMKKWKGVGYDFEIVKAEELQEYLDAGWFAHPDDLLKDVAEPEPEPEPELAVFDEYDLIEAMGDEAPSIEVARAAIRAATDLIDTYTRGAAYRRIRLPRPGVNAVAHSVAARIAANPGFISRRDQAGNFSRSLGAGFTGFTLTEKTALNSYRRTAR